MKQLLFLAGIILLASFSAPVDTLSKKERKFAASHLKSTKNDLIKSVKGMTDAQLNFKPSADKWSVKECVFHLALSENNLWQWTEGTLKAPANPEKRAEIKMTDEQVLAGVSSREHKIKTSETFEPKNAKWATVDEALGSLKEGREKLIDYMKNTTEDMRNHVATETPMGALDAYQLVLLLSAHTTRHMQQINELKGHPDFPKN
ncbi:MAG: DinB family protein [Ferruginibacter sp.]